MGEGMGCNGTPKVRLFDLVHIIKLYFVISKTGLFTKLGKQYWIWILRSRHVGKKRPQVDNIVQALEDDDVFANPRPGPSSSTTTTTTTTTTTKTTKTNGLVPIFSSSGDLPRGSFLVQILDIVGEDESGQIVALLSDSENWVTCKILRKWSRLLKYETINNFIIS